MTFEFIQEIYRKYQTRKLELELIWKKNLSAQMIQKNFGRHMK